MWDLSPLPLTGRREGEDPEPSCPSRDGLTQQGDHAASWPVTPLQPRRRVPGTVGCTNPGWYSDLRHAAAGEPFLNVSHLVNIIYVL